MSRPDLSVLKPPIHLGISGVRHIMECMETGTEEVKSALTEECDIIIECKVCKSMFRALPNYLAHKRVYCLESYQDTRLSFIQSQREEYTMIVQPEAPPGDNQPVNNQVHKSSGKSAGKTAQNTAERTILESADQTAQTPKSEEKAGQKLVENAATKSEEKVAQKAAEKAALKSAEKAGPKSTGKAEPKSAEKAAPKPAMKSILKSAEKLEHKLLVESTEKSPEKPAEESAEKTAQSSAQKQESAEESTKSSEPHSEEPMQVSADQSSKSAALDFYEKAITRCQVKGSMTKEGQIVLEVVEGNPNAMTQVVQKTTEESRTDEKPRAEKRTAETEVEEVEQEKTDETQSPHSKKAKMYLRENPKPKVRPAAVVSRTYKERLEGVPGCCITSLKCLLCGSKLSSHKSLYNHMMNMHSSTRTFYPCPYCQQSFLKPYSVVLHLEKQHKKSKRQVLRMKARLRSMAFKKLVSHSKNSIVIHNEDESEVTLGNDCPGEKANKAGKVKKGEKKKGEKEGKGGMMVSNMKPVVSLSPCVGVHKCIPCGRSFVKKDSLTRHLPFCMHRRKAITNELDPVKDVSEEEALSGPFADIDLFRGFTADMMKKVEHLIEPKMKLCRKCEADFETDDDLHHHIVKHLGLKRFKCKLCKFSCHTRSDCKYHLQSSHGSKVFGFSLLQFREYIIDLHPDKPLPRRDRSPRKYIKSADATTKSRSKKAELVETVKRSEVLTSKVLEIDPMEDDEVVEKEEKKKAKSKEEPKKKVAKKEKKNEDESEMLQVLSTRSGVKYKKPSLEEILKTKEKSGEDESKGEDARKSPPAKNSTSHDAKKEIVKRRESSREKKPPKAKFSPEPFMPVTQYKSKFVEYAPSSARKKLNISEDPSVKTDVTQAQKKESQKPRISRERTRTTPPRILRDAKSGQKSKSVASGVVQMSVTPLTASDRMKNNLGPVTVTALGPMTPLTASDLLKSNRRQSTNPASQSPSAQLPQSPPSPSLKTFDLSKAKVILSPLMTPGTPSEQLKISQSLLANTKSLLAGSKTIVVEDSKLPRLAPKPASNKDIVVLVENPSGVNNVLNAVDQAALQQTPVCTNVMYVLKDNTLTPVTQPRAGMTLVTIGGNPDVAGSCKVLSAVPIPK
ncbi:hypothetical protein CAPTEDRAFT_196053 [Capitella teleta]|uniref:C2H2-type domain-containing protein n=1 Tax=Capitella teleta TaxID=283909 RepID=R7TUA4_CAPTE|nr:hypothetical protein CAPTEDRAFT_196053 [Capitella teleta]|eukprot:ELT97172.1 hypothetical protein CAPTEDRAFT_196053 [Capitella teleta]